jgi:hypothetical protein
MPAEILEKNFYEIESITDNINFDYESIQNLLKELDKRFLQS